MYRFLEEFLQLFYFKVLFIILSQFKKIFRNSFLYLGLIASLVVCLKYKKNCDKCY